MSKSKKLSTSAQNGSAVFKSERLVFNVKSDRAPSGRTGLFVMGRMENKNDEI